MPTRRQAPFLDRNFSAVVQAGERIANALFDVRRMRWEFALRKAKLAKEEREKMDEREFQRELAAEKLKQKRWDAFKQREREAQEEQREEQRELNKFMATQQAQGVTFDPQAIQQARAQESFAPLTAPGATTPRPFAGADSDVRIRAFVKAEVGNEISGLENEIKIKQGRIKSLDDKLKPTDRDRVEKAGLKGSIKATQDKIKALKGQKAKAEIDPQAALTGARSLLKPTVPIEQSFQTPESQEKQAQLQRLLKSVNPTTGRNYTLREAEEQMQQTPQTVDPIRQEIGVIFKKLSEE